MNKNPCLGAALALAVFSANAGATGLCKASESTYFSCASKNGKWIGVCGTGGNAVQVRLGQPARLELQYPAIAAEAPSQLRLTHYARYQADRTELTFSDHGTDYAIFNYSEAGARTAGVRISPPDQGEREIGCRGAVTDRLSALADSLPCDPDNALSMGTCR